MATLLSCASGNFTSASTWALVDPTSFTGVGSDQGISTIITAYGTTGGSWTPGAITIDAVAVKLVNRAVSPTGTVSLALDQAGATVTGTEVTINVADLPLSQNSNSIEGGWTVFKFASPVTLAAATAYAVKLKTSSNGQLSGATAASGNWSRMLRTTTTQAPVAGDDMHVAGEYVGPGNNVPILVTVNSAVTSATDYGSAPSAANSLVTPGIGVSAKGTLSFSNAFTVTLRLSSSLLVYNGGTFTMGTVAAPVSDSVKAILEFDQLSADGDYGLVVRNGGTFVAQGQSRTAGKNVVSCKLAADAPLVLNTSPSPIFWNGSVTANNALEPTGISRTASTYQNDASNTNHGVQATSTAGSIPNLTITYSIWLARGSGTNNRYCRVAVGNSTSWPPTVYFYVDVDLQAGTTGTVTAVGSGAVATSSSITPLGIGYIVTIVGKLGTTTPIGWVLSANSLGGVTYAGDSTQCFIFYGSQLYTASALPSADLTVDTDTGWLAGDVIAVASTTRTYTDCEILALASNATSTTLTTTQVATVSHSGTTPTQAEIINLTRNIVIRSTSSTLMAYVNIQPGSTVDMDWVQFYYLGESTGNKRGIEVGSSTTLPVNFDMKYCSVHDCEDYGIYLFTTTGGILITSCIFAYNVMWNLTTTLGTAVQINGVTPTNWTLDHNILIRTGASRDGYTLSDVGGTFTNNIVAGAGNTGISLTESNRIGTFSGNVAHSCGSNGFNPSSVTGIIDTPVAWRNSAAGIAISTGINDLIVNSAILFGNTTNNVSFVGNDVWFKAPIMNGDTSYPTSIGINLNAASAALVLTIDDGDFSTVSGIKTAHSQFDISNAFTGNEPLIVLRNTKLGATTEFNQASSPISERGYVSSQKHDRTAGNHITWMKHGTVQSDTTLYRTAAPSLRMTPSMVAFPITASGCTVLAATNTITLVPSYFFDWVLVGDWLTASGFTGNVRVISLNAGTSTITVDRNSSGTSTSSIVTIYRGKLPSAPPGKGFQIPANAGQTFNVGVWVRKQQENLFTFSEDYSNAAWSVNNATRTGGQSDWAGGTTASQFLETTANNNAHGLSRLTSVIIDASLSLTYTWSFYVKGIGRQWIRISDNGSGSRFSWIDITNGVAGTTNAAHTITVTSAGSGWYRISIVFVPNFGSWGCGIYTATADNNSAIFVGDVTKGFLTGGWQMEQASTASIYQVTTASAISGYNGYVNPHLMQRANPAIGIASDTVLSTMSVGNGIWEQLTGTTVAPTGDKGVVELVVDCEGMAGWVNVDDFSVT